MNLTFRCPLGPLLLGVSLQGLSGMTLAATAAEFIEKTKTGPAGR